jgi:hypothetical protein
MNRTIGILDSMSGAALVVLLATTGMSACARKTQAPAEAGDPAPVDPAPVEQLQPVFAEIAGWKREPVTGQSGQEALPGMTGQVQFTGVQTTYTGSEIQVGVALLDSVEMCSFIRHQMEANRNQMIKVAFQHYPSWTNRNGNQLEVMIKRRFLITLETGLARNDLPTLLRLSQQFDVGRLERLN